jgi:hypothetical protein
MYGGVIATSKDDKVCEGTSQSFASSRPADHQKRGLSSFLLPTQVAVLFFNCTSKLHIFKSDKLTHSTPKKSNKMGLPESMKALRSVAPLSPELNNIGDAKRRRIADAGPQILQARGVQRRHRSSPKASRQ